MGRPGLLSMTCPPLTLRLLLISAGLRVPFIPCMLRLMTCFIRPRILRKRPRKPWLMLQDLLMSSVLSKSMLLPKRKPRGPLRVQLLNLTNDLQRPMKLLPRVDAMPWLSLSLVSESLKLSLAAARAKHLKITRPSKRLSAASRNCNSNKMRTKKIKTYKKQIEEAEEIAALNLAKYRKAQQEMEESEERAKMAGAQLSFARAGSMNL